MKPVLPLVAVLLAVVVRLLAAQSCNANNPAGSCKTRVTIPSVTFPTVLEMTISGTSAPLTAPTLSDFGLDSTATIIDPALTTVTAKGNAGFHVTLRSTSANWTTTGTPPTPKPASDLAWGTAPTGPFVPVTTTATTILTSASRSNGVSIGLSFRTAWHFIQNTTGTYSLPLTFTLVSP